MGEVQDLTTESLVAGAKVAAGHVLAGSTVHTRVGLAFVVVDVTVGPTPARVAVTLVALIPEERNKTHGGWIWLLFF